VHGPKDLSDAALMKALSACAGQVVFMTRSPPSAGGPNPQLLEDDEGATSGTGLAAAHPWHSVVDQQNHSMSPESGRQPANSAERQHHRLHQRWDKRWEDCKALRQDQLLSGAITVSDFIQLSRLQ